MAGAYEINRLPKYVVSASRNEQLTWQPSMLPLSDVAEALRRDTMTK